MTSHDEEDAPLPGDGEATVVRPDSPALRYEGRWDVRTHAATTVTSGSRVFLRFSGDEVSARFDTAGVAYPPQVHTVVDGVWSAAVVVDRERIRLTPDGLPPGSHELMLAVKDVDERGERWTPPLTSALHLTGFDLPTGSEVYDAAPVPATRLTFLGDSITQGVNVLGTESGPDGADATRAYPWLVAAAFDAGLEQVGFGGQGLTTGGSGGVPPAAATVDHAHAGVPVAPWTPQVVVLNQGTNDDLDGADEPTVESAYRDYLHRVRAHYPDALILAMDPVGVDGAGTRASAPIRRAVAAHGDPRVAYVPTTDWTGPDDFTEGLHPNPAGHRTLATHLTAWIAARAGLRPRAPDVP